MNETMCLMCAPDWVVFWIEMDEILFLCDLISQKFQCLCNCSSVPVIWVCYLVIGSLSGSYLAMASRLRHDACKLAGFMPPPPWSMSWQRQSTQEATLFYYLRGLCLYMVVVLLMSKFWDFSALLINTLIVSKFCSVHMHIKLFFYSLHVD